MQSCNLTFVISAIACELAKGKTTDEIILLGSVFSQLGDTLNTIAAQDALCSCDNSDKQK
ncbi:MAG: DUF6774 domain-containing protein [Lachnospira sp.]